MRIAYIRWRDAMTDETGEGPARAELAELEAVGWIVAESPDAIQIAMEMEPQQDGLSGAGRWRLTVPKVCILRMEIVEQEYAFRQPRTTKAKNGGICVTGTAPLLLTPISGQKPTRSGGKRKKEQEQIVEMMNVEGGTI